LLKRIHANGLEILLNPTLQNQGNTMGSGLELADQIIETASRKRDSDPVDSETKRALVKLTTTAKARAGDSVKKLDTSVTAEVQSWTAVRLWAEAAKATIEQISDLVH
jgi:hypothetical protein